MEPNVVMHEDGSESVYATANSSHDDKFSPEEIEEILCDRLEFSDAIYRIERQVYSGKYDVA